MCVCVYVCVQILEIVSVPMIPLGQWECGIKCESWQRCKESVYYFVSDSRSKIGILWTQDCLAISPLHNLLDIRQTIHWWIHFCHAADVVPLPKWTCHDLVIPYNTLCESFVIDLVTSETWQRWLVLMYTCNTLLSNTSLNGDIISLTNPTYKNIAILRPNCSWKNKSIS